MTRLIVFNCIQAIVFRLLRGQGQRLHPVVPAKAGTSIHNVLGSCFRKNDG